MSSHPSPFDYTFIETLVTIQLVPGIWWLNFISKNVNGYNPHWGDGGHKWNRRELLKLSFLPTTYKKCRVNKDLMYSTWISAQCYVAVWMGGGLGENEYVHVSLSPFTSSPETIAALLMGYVCSARKLQPFPTLCDPMDCSPPSSSVHGILQARIREWVAVPSSRESSWLRDQTYLSCGSCMAGRFFTSEPPGKPLIGYTPIQNKKFKKIAGSKSLRSAFTLKDFLMEKLLLINFLTFNISVS